MEHIRIWIQIATLLVGTGAIFDTIRMHGRYGLPLLRRTGWCLLFLNLGFLVTLLSQYLLVNYFRNLAVFKASEYMAVSDPFSGLVLVGLVYCLTWLRYDFAGRQFPRFWRWLLGILAAAQLTVLTAMMSGAGEAVAGKMGIGILLTASVLIVGVLGEFAVRPRTRTGPVGGRSIRILGAYYLVGCLSVAISAVVHSPFHGVLWAGVGLSFNIFPFVWYRRYLLGAVAVLKAALTPAGVAAVSDRFELSARQRDIVDLVLQGKSNREIADELFIAPHTVKNHLYGLYQKLGVKSRFELVALFVGPCRK